MSYDTNRCLSSYRAWISLLLTLTIAFSMRVEEEARDDNGSGSDQVE
jgi:hypothetical protein